MAIFDIVQAVRDGQARYTWYPITVAEGDLALTFAVTEQPLLFDGVPPMRWNRQIIPSHQRYDGVRLPATALELQEIADILGGLLLTPKVLDLLTLEARDRGLLIDADVSGDRGERIATYNVHAYHEELERDIARAGGYPEGGGVIASLGKYWVLCLALVSGQYGERQAINYGWYSRGAPHLSVTRALRLYQRPRGCHPDEHLDTSQMVRFMGRLGILTRLGSAPEQADLENILQHSETASLLSHEGPLPVIRMPRVPVPAQPFLDGARLTA